jgi:hypothetical protein
MAQSAAETGLPENRLTRQALRTPRAAALAGIAFTLLFSISVWLIRLTLPLETELDAFAWLESSSWLLQVGLALIPLAGIAFLWFMGVVRDRLGSFEDQFFSTVFFGSGLLFLAMIFCSAALATGIIGAYEGRPDAESLDVVADFGLTTMYTITNVYAMRMAGVFMMSLATIWYRTRVMPRAFAILSYILAIGLLVITNYSLWMLFVFPAWVLGVSMYVLVSDLRRGHVKEI